MNGEINNLLNVQKRQLGKIEEQKILLLGSGSEDTKYDHIKEAFGWNDTDKKLRAETNKILEIAKRTKENVDSSVLTEDILYKYCIANNYALINVRDYKGKIPNELLEAISEYCTKNDRSLRSEANIQNLYILCPFSDTRSNNGNIKKSKRYKKGIMSKIILLEKLDKGNSYSEQHYKTIFEIGKTDKISNAFKSIYFTHPKSGNHFNTFLFFSGILLLLLITTYIICYIGNFTRDSFNGIWYISPTFIYIGLFGMIITSLIPQGPKSEQLICRSYDNDYERIDKEDYAIKWFLTSFMFKQYEDVEIVKKLSFWRNQIAMWSMNIIFFLFFSGVIHLMKCSVINKNKIIKHEIERTKAPDHINDVVTIELYQPKGKFNYTKQIVKETVGQE